MTRRICQRQQIYVASIEAISTATTNLATKTVTMPVAISPIRHRLRSESL